MNLQEIFTTRFKHARKAKNLTQEQLGIAIGLDEFVAALVLIAMSVACICPI